MRAVLRVLAAGSGSTVQDLGRTCACHLGVPFSGAVDDYAHRIANWLVGNPAHRATLENTLGGMRIEILDTCDLTVTGARLGLRLNGRPVRQWASLRVHPGDLLELGLAENGCRAYLAVTGGIDVPEVLGSRSTYLAGGTGGLEGRAVTVGDILPRGESPLLSAPRMLPWEPRYGGPLLLRAVLGPHDHCFRQEKNRLFTAPYTLSPESNRMGCRLQGPPIPRDAGAPASILSEPVVPGMIQIPADGQPILLLREQTIGGYTAIATVLSTDLWRIGQVRPGDRVRFVSVSLADGQAIVREWLAFLAATERLLVC